jgi:Cytochrome c7 and related cytochrome c
VRRWLSLSALALAAAVIVTACREYLPSNRYLQLRQPSQARTSTADARGKFNHQAHHAILAERQVNCLDCHRFDVLIDAGNEQMARELSMQAQYPGGAACHYCHTSEQTRVAKAPSACTTCHENLMALRPTNHEVGWLKVHASVAQVSSPQCESCHRQSFCIDCHERRDTIQTRMHDRNFRFFHSVEARANPMRCGSCHREDFCIRCHQQDKVDVNP